ncbi:MAG TPA: putative ABC transporter permease [Candidatus Caccenecus avistercoris]|nr:putative ABC transporter permease [Candidatus Caccenecus avistercoris]
MYYVNIFFIFSFIGFLFENVLNIFTNDNFNSGVLYGPWTFIYGIGVLLMVIVYKFLQQYHLKKWKEVVLFYIIITIVMTLVEFSGGMLIETIFHRTYWDYTNMRFNYGKYICLEVSLAWGLLATFITYLVLPFINKIEKKIPWFVSVGLIILFIVDIIFTLIN